MTTQTHNPQIFYKNDTSADVLAIMEQDSIEASAKGIRQTKKDFVMNPAPFPEGDDRWQNMFDIKRYNKLVDIYFDGPSGKALYGVTRRDYINDDGVADKNVFPFYYDQVQDRFVKGNPYNNKTRLLHEQKFPKFDPTAPRSLLWVEGEKTCHAAQKLFPWMICTTASGGVQNIGNINDISVVQDFREIIMWADNDAEGKDKFLEVAQTLQDNFPDIQVRYVDVPKSLPAKWDLADYKEGDDIRIREILDNALPVDEYGMYNNVKRDAKNNRWLYLKKINYYYDTIEKEAIPEKNLNSLYLRDTGASGNAHREIQSRKAEVVSGYAFKISNDLVVKIDGRKHINTFTPVNFDSMLSDDIKALSEDPEIKRMLHHLYRLVSKDEYLFKHLCSTLAHDIQFPEKNRIWATLVCSTAGWGKSWLWTLLTALNGIKNTQWLDQEEIYARFRDWIPKTNMVIIDELRWDKQSQSIFISKMKTLITQPKHRSESKGRDTIDFYGHYKFWVSSNDFVPFEIDEHERRWHVLHVKEESDDVMRECGDDYYDKLFSLVGTPEEPNYDFFKKAFHFWNNYKIDYNIFDLNKCPVTRDKEDLKQMSWSQNDRDLMDLLQGGKAPFDKGMVSAESIMQKVRMLWNDLNYKNTFRGLDTNGIVAFLRDRLKRKKVWKGRIIQLGDDPNRRNFWDITEDQRWVHCTDISLMREHMKGNLKINPKQNVLKFKENKNDDQNRTEGVNNDPF